MPLSRLQQLRQDFQGRRKTENKIKLQQIVAARRLKDRESSMIQPMKSKPRQHKSSYQPQGQRRSVRDQLSQRRASKSPPVDADNHPTSHEQKLLATAGTPVNNAVDFNPHNLLPAIGAGGVADTAEEDAAAAYEAHEQQQQQHTRATIKTPGRANDRYSKSRGASRGRSAATAPDAAQHADNANNFPSAPNSPVGAAVSPIPQPVAEHAPAPPAAAPPSKAAGGKKTKKQKQEELKAEKEQARKDAITARKKKRDDMHRARAVEREARRQREEAEKAAAEGADDIAGDLFAGDAAGSGVMSPSRDTVVSVGDRVVFNETSAEGLPIIDRVYHENSVTEQLDGINSMDDSELPMSPRKTPVPSSDAAAMPPPPYPEAEFPTTDAATSGGGVARTPEPDAAVAEAEAEPSVPAVSRTGLIPASERKKMNAAKSKSPVGPPPTALKALTIKTGVVKRLNKEAQAYRKEGAQQLKKLASLRNEAFQDFEASKMEEVVEETIRVIMSVEDKLSVGIMDLIAVVEETPALEGSEEHAAAMDVLKVARDDADARMHDKLKVPPMPTKEEVKPKKKKKGMGRKSKTPTPASPHRPTESELAEIAAAETEAQRQDESAAEELRASEIAAEEVKQQMAAEAAEAEAEQARIAAADARAAEEAAAAEQAEQAAAAEQAEQAAAAAAAAAAAKPRPPATPKGKKGAKVRGRASKAAKKAKSPEPQPVAKSPMSPAATAAEKDERAVAMSPIAMNGGAADAYLAQLDAFGSEAHAPVVNLAPCSCCGRKFNPDRIAKHEITCKASKDKASKRKVFDQKKARIAGTDAAQHQGASKAQEKKYEKAAAKSKNWKLKSEQFRAGLKAARDPNAAPAAPVENPDYVQCPHCSRKFNEGAAERHMPRCAESSAKAKARAGNTKSKKKAKYDPRKKK